jgi:hypothetical protein
MEEHGHKLHLTIIVDGIPKSEEFPANMKVEAVIKQLLTSGQKQNWEKYQLTNSSQKILDPSLSLQDNGVKNGDTLALTLKDGGGGNFLIQLL